MNPCFTLLYVANAGQSAPISKPNAKQDIYTNPSGAKLQNRQFNTPIGLYGSETITDTLEGKTAAITLNERRNKDR